MAKISAEVEKRVAEAVIGKEWETAKRNKNTESDEFKDAVNLLDSVREPKQYEWMSDVRLPEFTARFLTQASIDANQYFTTREFTEVYIEDKSDKALNAAEATKELINRTLNQKHLYHYPKYMRGKNINNLAGRVYARVWWEKKYKEVVSGEVAIVDGEEFDITDEELVMDRFNYDILSPDQVFTTNEYSYSLQQKSWVFIHDEVTVHSLYEDEEDMGYFNLKKVQELSTQDETEVSKNTYNKNTNETPPQAKVHYDLFKVFDRVERYGKFWCVVKERDENDYPIDIVPGIDQFGKRKKGAVLLETIMTFVISGSSKVLIRFQPTPYINADGEPFKPLIRGLCYIHPTKDIGFGDGSISRELQLAIDDTFNISNDRVQLATLPTMKVNSFEAEDNPDIFIEPGHTIPLESVDNLEELVISDDIQGALAQGAQLRQSLNQAMAVFPTTMGDVPGEATTTATAVASGGEKTDLRSNYKALTFENTFLVELYEMIQQLTWTFASPETGEKLMGEKVVNFDPTLNYFYKPVSQAIEPEYAKANKIKLLTQIFGYVVNIPHPDTVKVVNYIVGKMMTLMGDEFENYKEKMFNEQVPIQTQTQNVEQEGFPTTNEQGIPQSAAEQGVRGL